MEIKEEDRKKTAFITKYGLFEHIKMGFGLCNAPTNVCPRNEPCVKGSHLENSISILDNILVLGISFENHLQNLSEVLIRMPEYGLKLKPKKCLLFKKEVEFLGRIVSGNKLAMSAQNTQVIMDWPKDVHGGCTYCTRADKNWGSFGQQTNMLKRCREIHGFS